VLSYEREAECNFTKNLQGPQKLPIEVKETYHRSEKERRRVELHRIA
jgi:hypothetical protein